MREPQAMLFTPGTRLGWIFRDRRTLLAPYPEPEPDLDKLREETAARTAAAQARYAKVRRWAGEPSLIVAIHAILDDPGKILAAVCHGPASFLPAHRPDGTWLFSGRTLTGFSRTRRRPRLASRETRPGCWRIGCAWQARTTWPSPRGHRMP